MTNKIMVKKEIATEFEEELDDEDLDWESEDDWEEDEEPEDDTEEIK